MDTVSLIRQAQEAGLAVRVEEGNLKVTGEASAKASLIVEKLRQRKQEIVKLWHDHQKYVDLMAQPCLWGDEAAEVILLAKKFGYKIDILRTKMIVNDAAVPAEWKTVLSS